MGNVFEVCFNGDAVEVLSIELDIEFLDTIAAKTSEDTLVVVLKFKSLHNLGVAIHGKIGPFIELKLIPPDPIAGDQKQ
jgi:hypothetical protein